MVGSAVTGVVLPLVVYQITGSAAQTGALFALRVAARCPPSSGPSGCRRNGALSSLSSCSEIAGPVIAGLLAASIGATNAIWIDAASFFITAAVLSSIRSTFRESGATPEPTASLRSAVARAIRFIRGERTVATLLIVGFGNSFAFGTVLGLLVPYAVEELGVGADDTRIGLFYGALGVGSLIAGLIFARLFRPGRVRVLTPGSLAVSGIIVALLAVNTSWLVALIAITYRQLAAPDDLRSSVNVIGRMTAWGGQPFGAATGASIAALAGVPTAYAVAAFVMLVASGGATAALRTGRSAPTRQPVEETERGL